jgi:BlaI family transcriptional regulator, penicillinase repressor
MAQQSKAISPASLDKLLVEQYYAKRGHFQESSMTHTEPTERELEALKLLWRRERATVREIWNELSQVDRDLAYTTVLSLLQTMEQKGLVGHEALGRAYAYFARVDEKKTLGQLARRFLDRVFDGAVDEYLVRALETGRTSAKELDRLEQMIAEAKQKARRRPKTGD